MTNAVVVTGLGVVSALGLDVDAFWNAALAGETRVESVPAHWHEYADYGSTLWSPLPALDLEAMGFSRVERAQYDPVSLIAEYASRRAVLAAGFTLAEKDRRARTCRVEGVDPERAGVFMGTGVGGASSFLANHSHQVLARTRERVSQMSAGAGEAGPLGAIRERMVHPGRFNPFAVSMLMPNAVSAYVGLKLSLNGPNVTFGIACASGTVAVGRAFRALRAGEVDVAVCGASEYLDDHYGGIFHGFDIARTLVRDCADPVRANRPFDVGRSGFLFSQGGAAALVLETERHAHARGARAIAGIEGYAESFDAHSMMSMAPDGVQIERMIRAALADAGLEPADIGYVNAHGTGTVANDEAEAAILERVFGGGAAISSTKSLIGHTIGASGAIEAVVAALSLDRQTVHPCRALETPVRDLDFPTRARRETLDAAFSQSFAFGGHNAGLVLRRTGEPG